MFVALLFLLMQPAFGIYHDLYQHGGSIQHFRRQSNYIPRYPTVYPPFTTTSEPGTTPEKVTISPEDEQKADEIGIRIPPDECIISWDQFKEHVVGRNWLDIYDIDDDDALFPGAITLESGQ
ncbi:uncharacterized protein LOC132731055 [Ruditapes philippinarum]|uniref:uncharacterized protein LOC132731055 n=1 Tax=Ruditapes philippinarum TaxID=129788 RepID=UPI00295B0D97|nr:uncharacterized protein LOC132731055 [Ruditapes philippinarum]